MEPSPIGAYKSLQNKFLNFTKRTERYIHFQLITIETFANILQRFHISIVENWTAERLQTVSILNAAHDKPMDRMNAYEDIMEQNGVTRVQTVDKHARPNTQLRQYDLHLADMGTCKRRHTGRSFSKSYTTQEWHRLETLDNTGQHKDIISYIATGILDPPKPTQATQF